MILNLVCGTAYVTVFGTVSLPGCLHSTVNITLIRKQCHIRMICGYYYVNQCWDCFNLCGFAAPANRIVIWERPKQAAQKKVMHSPPHILREGSLCGKGDPQSRSQSGCASSQGGWQRTHQTCPRSEQRGTETLALLQYPHFDTVNSVMPILSQEASNWCKATVLFSRNRYMWKYKHMWAWPQHQRFA